MAQVGFESFDSIRYKEAGTLRHFEHKDWFTVMRELALVRPIRGLPPVSVLLYQLTMMFDNFTPSCWAIRPSIVLIPTVWVVDVTCHKCDWIEKDIKERTIWKCQLQAALPFSEVSKNYNRAPRAPRDARRERNIRSRASSPYGVQSESGQSNATSRDETFPAPRSNTKANGRETEQWQYGESASPRSRMKSGQSDATTRDDTFSVPRNNTKVNAWDTEPGQSEDSASLRSRIESGEIPQPEVDCFGWPIMDGQAAKAVGPSPWD